MSNTQEELSNANQNYWDIDDILMQEEIVTVKCNTNQKFNGFLDKNQENIQDLQKDQELELPFWLALNLASCRIKNNDDDDDDDDDDDESTNLVDINLPKYYSEKFLESIKSDPKIINLRDKNQYFYEYGMTIAEYMMEPSIIKVLEQAYLKRIKEFIRVSQHTVIEDCNNMVRKMADLEQSIFNKSRKKATQIREWKLKGENFEKYAQTIQKLKVIQNKQF